MMQDFNKNSCRDFIRIQSERDISGSPALSDIIFLRMTETQRLWVSGEFDEVWNDSTPSMVLQSPSIMRWSICQALRGLSHFEEIRTVGIAMLEHASNKSTDYMSIVVDSDRQKGYKEGWIQCSYKHWISIKFNLRTDQRKSLPTYLTQRQHQPCYSDP